MEAKAALKSTASASLAIADPSTQDLFTCQPISNYFIVPRETTLDLSRQMTDCFYPFIQYHIFDTDVKQGESEF